MAPGPAQGRCLVVVAAVGLALIQEPALIRLALGLAVPDQGPALSIQGPALG